MDNNKYNQKYFSDNSVIKKYVNHKSEKRLDFLAEYKIIDENFTDKNSKILIIGCGAGRSYNYLISKGFTNIYAFDLNLNMLNEGKKHNNKMKLFCANAVQMPLRNNFFQYIIFPYNGIDFIYPKSKRIECLKEVKRSLDENGVFIYSTHNKYWLRWFLTYGFKVYLYNLKKRHFSTNYLYIKMFKGDLLTYITSPFKEVRKLKKIGFKDIIIKGRYKRLIENILKDPYPHIICKKND